MQMRRTRNYLYPPSLYSGQLIDSRYAFDRNIFVGPLQFGQLGCVVRCLGAHYLSGMNADQRGWLFGKASVAR